MQCTVLPHCQRFVESNFRFHATIQKRILWLFKNIHSTLPHFYFEFVSNNHLKTESPKLKRYAAKIVLRMED